MCRYAAKAYKTHYVCFRCLCTVKKLSGYSTCPECGSEMLEMGLDFKAPKKQKIGQWKKLYLITDHGETPHVFASCGCCGPGYRPATYAEAKSDPQWNSKGVPEVWPWETQ